MQDFYEKNSLQVSKSKLRHLKDAILGDEIMNGKSVPLLDHNNNNNNM